MAAAKEDEFFGYGCGDVHSTQLTRKTGVRKGGGADPRP
jgi:hypothetical protein